MMFREMLKVASAGGFCLMFVSIHWRTASMFVASAFETVLAMLTITVMVAIVFTPSYSLTYPTS